MCKSVGYDPRSGDATRGDTGGAGRVACIFCFNPAQGAGPALCRALCPAARLARGRHHAVPGRTRGGCLGDVTSTLGTEKVGEWVASDIETQGSIPYTHTLNGAMQQNFDDIEIWPLFLRLR